MYLQCDCRPNFGYDSSPLRRLLLSKTKTKSRRQRSNLSQTRSTAGSKRGAALEVLLSGDILNLATGRQVRYACLDFSLDILALCPKEARKRGISAGGKAWACDNELRLTLLVIGNAVEMIHHAEEGETSNVLTISVARSLYVCLWKLQPPPTRHLAPWRHLSRNRVNCTSWPNVACATNPFNALGSWGTWS